LGKGGELDISHDIIDVGQPMKVYESVKNTFHKNIALLGVGTVMQQVVAAAEALRDQYNIDAYSVAQIKPINADKIIGICKENSCVVTVEEHNIIGGLGSTVAEIIAENQLNARLVRIGMRDQFTEVVGSPDYLRRYYGIDSAGICSKIRELVN
jgi:transketolase